MVAEHPVPDSASAVPDMSSRFRCFVEFHPPLWRIPIFVGDVYRHYSAAFLFPRCSIDTLVRSSLVGKVEPEAPLAEAFRGRLMPD
jgi:hypothetical protein